jgi:hypothetical protein
MVNCTHGDLVEVAVLVIRIFRGEQSHYILNNVFLYILQRQLTLFSFSYVPHFC